MKLLSAHRVQILTFLVAFGLLSCRVEKELPAEREITQIIDQIHGLAERIGNDDSKETKMEAIRNFITAVTPLIEARNGYLTEGGLFSASAPSQLPGEYRALISKENLAIQALMERIINDPALLSDQELITEWNQIRQLGL
ncbi:MAG: hypothetical protein JW765_00075 [Deltaproteobacteria bacterium]|nr:hypothetical protein [Candidatus Zymogenaceae bacterium]